MYSSLRTYWPEIIIGIAAVFFTFRELGTFPAAWLDDSLFMVVAQHLATGRGYVLPVLTEEWVFPYILGVGPTIILPAALSIWLFGFSVAIARLPFAFLVLATIWLTYSYGRSIADRRTARWSTALLVSFSAFVNTGKPVLGEIPAFFFLLLGLLVLSSSQSLKHFSIAGVLLGVAVVTKVTFGIVYPAIAVVWIFAVLRRDVRVVRAWTVLGALAALVFGLWKILEMAAAPGSFLEILQYGLAGGGEGMFRVLREQPMLLLRFQYVYLLGMLAVGLLGVWRLQRSIGYDVALFIALFVLFFFFYFLNGPGWYRHVLPAHILLLPFIPAGMVWVFRKHIATACLLLCVVAQGIWQWDHRGSIRSDEAVKASERVLQDFSETEMVIREPEIYMRLPYADHRYFLSEEMQKRNFTIFPSLPVVQEEYCLPLLRKIGTEERPAFAGRITEVYKRYVLLDPPKNCRDTL